MTSVTFFRSGCLWNNISQSCADGFIGCCDSKLFELYQLGIEKQKRAEILLWKLVEHNIKYFWD